MRGRVCNLLLLLVLASAITVCLPSLTRGQACLLSVSVIVSQYVHRYLHKIFTLSVFDTVQGCIYKASFSPGSVQQIMLQLLVAYITMTV
jgi:hypothetical protein